METLEEIWAGLLTRHMGRGRVRLTDAMTPEQREDFMFQVGAGCLICQVGGFIDAFVADKLDADQFIECIVIMNHFTTRELAQLISKRKHTAA